MHSHKWGIGQARTLISFDHNIEMHGMTANSLCSVYKCVYCELEFRHFYRIIDSIETAFILDTDDALCTSNRGDR